MASRGWVCVLIMELVLAFLAMPTSAVQSSGDLFQGTGKVGLAHSVDPADSFYVIRNFDNRYFQPMNLPSTFSVDQLKIRFAANLTGEFTSHGLEAIMLNSISLLGDVDGDLDVDSIDVYWLQQAFGLRPSSIHWNIVADLNFDNIVDVQDAILLASNYGSRVKQFGLKVDLVDNVTEYNLGDPINVTLTITNITNDTVDFLSAPSWWNLFVYNDTNNLLYEWASGRIFPFYIVHLTLGPGEKVSESMTWPQTCDAVLGDFGTPIAQVSQGTYYLVGFYFGYDLRTLPVQIKIV